MGQTSILPSSSHVHATLKRMAGTAGFQDNQNHVYGNRRHCHHTQGDHCLLQNWRTALQHVVTSCIRNPHFDTKSCSLELLLVQTLNSQVERIWIWGRKAQLGLLQQLHILHWIQASLLWGTVTAKPQPAKAVLTCIFIIFLKKALPSWVWHPVWKSLHGRCPSIWNFPCFPRSVSSTVLIFTSSYFCKQ